MTNSLKIRRKCDDIIGSAITLNALGTVYSKIARLLKSKQWKNTYINKAISCLKESEQLRLTVNDNYGLAITLNTIGRIYSFIENYEDAINALQKSKEIFKSYKVCGFITAISKGEKEGKRY